MNSFFERATLLNEPFLGIFEGFCLKVSEDFFDRTPPCTFAVIVNRFWTVFLRKSRIMLTITSIIKSF